MWKCQNHRTKSKPEETTKMIYFIQFFHFVIFTSKGGVTLRRKCAKPGTYYLIACSTENAMEVIANRLHNYSERSRAKTVLRHKKAKTVSENRKSIFIAILMPHRRTQRKGGTRWRPPNAVKHFLEFMFFDLRIWALFKKWWPKSA